MELLDGGWGVMMDDLLAGVYANVILQIIVLVKPL
jgi:phosphatidylglycerophosphatase A